MKETVIQMLGNSTIPTSEIILTLMISVIASFYIYFKLKIWQRRLSIQRIQTLH